MQSRVTTIPLYNESYDNEESRPIFREDNNDHSLLVLLGMHELVLPLRIE